MHDLLKDIKDEVQQFLNGKTIDALIPPLVYLLANRFFSLKMSIFFALGTALVFAFFRLLKKETVLYALGGIFGVLVASGSALLFDSAESYFLPGIISSGFMFLLALISVLIGRPMAAVLSHLSRSWDWAWFMRDDIKPAYKEVSLAWSLLFFLRMLLQTFLYLEGSLSKITWANILLGFPTTLLVLILTLVYGVWRLKNLGGPGIDEFQEGNKPPWRGQRKGF